MCGVVRGSQVCMSDSTAHIMFESSTVSVSSIHVFVCYILSHFSCVWLFATPWTSACQAPLSMGFSRQEYWSELSFPSTGDLPNPGIKPMSLMSPALACEFFATSVTWEAPCMCICPKEEERLFTELKHQWPQKHSLGFLYRGQHNTERSPHHKQTSLTLS